ncbi:MAG: Rdx family protein [Planctomycetota bacterium]
MPQATSLAAYLEQELGVQAELIRGDRGIFDVVIDGELRFSKHEAGRFPKNEEILALARG